MMSLILSVVATVVVAGGYIFYKFRKANREIDRLFATVNRLESEKAEKEAKIQQQKAEVKNAKTQQKHTQNTARISSDAVDMQLHQHGYFRDDGLGLHGVPSAVSKPSGHGGDQTSDTSSQSDL
ncbi:Protein of uncharacterised function (DUF2681) [Mannheimia haemolytica]|uniref:Protein of uncharacterized function (DUF2681) n=1 Tax=Mannheimia haemolytica TaxID=75985 RepID=A0A448T494_MANHA|nr:DUF2681 domain-containing protein [Mannheimia haemolytica]VEI74751.1 Protein of uncharacterised function (DUF2681) [Mannheimia haemolytica]